MAKKSSFEPVILGSYSIDRFRSAETIGIVGIGNRLGTLVYRGEVAAVLPSEGAAVDIAEGIADGIIGGALAVVGVQLKGG